MIKNNNEIISFLNDLNRSSNEIIINEALIESKQDYNEKRNKAGKEKKKETV
jgi:hypothetical protein